MDATISRALEEICSSGESGVTLGGLWSALGPSLAAANLDLSPGLKQAVWTALLAVPALRFEPRAAATASSSAAAAEELGATVAADESLRDSFLGLYNPRSVNAAIPPQQRRALERLAVARNDGIIQSQLAKEFGMEGKNMFYVLRSLESQGLIVKQSAVLKTKEACEEGESRYIPSVTTNLVYLSRYAKLLGSQQKFQITHEEQSAESHSNLNGGTVSGDRLIDKKVKEDVLVKDYLPEMKAICDLLEKANGKVLVVTDIKKELGYTGSASKHRGWKQVSSRLKDAEIVLEFDAKVNEKVERCMRLLKTSSANDPEPKPLGCVDHDLGDEQVKFGKRNELRNQVVELPIEHQIYDLIDAAGSEGLTMLEISKSLGIDNKKYHNRLVNMFSRLGMNVQAENQKKTVVYRVWTPGQHNPESAQEVPSKSNAFNDDRISRMDFGNLGTPDRPAKASVLTGDVTSHVKIKNKEINYDLATGSPSLIDAVNNLLNGNSPERHLESRDAFPEPPLDLAIVELEGNDTSSKVVSVPLKHATSGSNQRQQSSLVTVDSIRRKKKILERLQNEKFMIRVELQKWLESIEKDKGTTTDKKTIIRILKELQEQGHCRCIDINIPFVTKVSSSRSIQVVLHPSVSLSPELVSEIHDQLRSFEIRCRGQSRPKNSDFVPVLKDVERTKINTNLNAQAIQSEARRANGFILAKMIRAKLLHGFLWEHAYGSKGSNDTLSSESGAYDLSNFHNDTTLFSLDAAIKAIPIELFLQVVGSTEKFDDMIEKCRRRLCLSDVPIQEYKSLMDTRAMGRLSLVVEILRRLKLLRMVNHQLQEDGSELLQATVTHALEFRPYIEEPVSKDAISLTFRPLDFRPRIRHDFLLSNRKAVDEYWETLEYCYAAADARAALHAFPGSAVHELFIFRSWASVRVMTADQRAQLLKRLTKDDQSVKLSFKDCGKIAKDLNLSLEQVLRVYHDKRQSRLNKFTEEREDFQTLRSNRISSVRRRERSPDVRSVKSRKVDEVTGELDEQRLAEFPDTVDTSAEGELLVTTRKLETDVQALQEADHVENEGELEPSEDDGEASHSVISRSAFSKIKPPRQRRFTWTEEADRQLVVQYARYRAALGAKNHRTEWASIFDLPAPPTTCKKRMAWLNKNVKFRKAVMVLCNELSELYVKFLEKTKNSLLEKGDGGSQDACDEHIYVESYNDNEHTQGTGNGDSWDNFENSRIKIALDEVLRCKRMAKLEASKKLESTYEEWSDLNIDAEKQGISEFDVIASTSSRDAQNNVGMQKKSSSRRSRAQRLHRRFIKLLNEEVNVSRKVYNSVAISNAVELFKLVFLNTSTASVVPNMLSEILRCYSEHDLFAAFNYLREKNFMVGGGNQPFSLSQQFMHNVSKSPFPANSGTRAAKFAKWLHERERDLAGGIDLSTDLQCGDIFHLFALVSSGQLSLSPSLPDEGVGEVEDTRSLKRKFDSTESSDGDKAKKLKSLVAAEGEIISRREKGFPGIMVSVHQTSVPAADIVNLFKAEKTCTVEQSIDGNDSLETTSDSITLSHSHHGKEILDSTSNISLIENVSESPWTAMASYAAYLLPEHSNGEKSSPIKPEIFSTVNAAIRKAGDQGLSIEEVSQLINMLGTDGEKMSELVISVLQTFGRALKVNGFDSVHIVDASYRCKYSLTSGSDICQVPKASSWEKTMKGNNSHSSPRTENPDSGSAHLESNVNVDAVHKVSVLNFPEEVTESFSGNQTSNLQECCFQGSVVLPRADMDSEYLFTAKLGVSILPWINGDGTVNKGIYKGLRRRILGIVMQNPGILEEDIINQMDVLNPQSCRKLLELMVLDKHIRVKKMHQTTSSNAPPSILGSLFRSGSFGKPKLVCREHYFANPLSTSLL